MRYEWPSKTFIWPLSIVLLFGLAKDSLTTWVSGLVLPDWFIWLLVGVFVGSLINDILNPRSWFRHNWRVSRRLFDVETVHAGHHQWTPEHIELVCILKFRKEITKARLTVCVVTPFPTKDADKKISHNETIDLVKDSTKRLILGNIAITRAGDPYACHSVWGEKVGSKDLEGGQLPITGLSRVTLEVSVNHQTYRIYAHILDANREESSKIYLLTEDQFPSLI